MNSTTSRQASRTRRAVEEASSYTISRAVKVGPGAGFSFWVANDAKRSLYLVHEGRCSCPDNTRRPELRCKHILMVERFLGIGEALPADDSTTDLEPCEFESIHGEPSEAPPSVEEEIKLGLQDEDRWQRIRADRDALWPE